MRPTAAAAVVVGALALSGCSALVPGGGGFACTAIGAAEGVTVDLSQVLPLEGGDYYAEVSVPSLGAADVRGFAGNDGYYPAGDVEADLSDEPVEVRVRVVTERGDIAYETSDTAQPELFQPNGAGCDGDNHRLWLVAKPSGELAVHEGEDLPTDSRGRTSESVSTECGVEAYSDGLRVWRRLGGVLDDGSGGPPPGWNAPAQRGWMAPLDEDTLRFEDERGHVERFELVRDDWFPDTCG